MLRIAKGQLECFLAGPLPLDAGGFRPWGFPMTADIFVIALGDMASRKLPEEGAKTQRAGRVGFHLCRYVNPEGRRASRLGSERRKAFTEAAGAGKDVNNRNGHEMGTTLQVATRMPGGPSLGKGARLQGGAGPCECMTYRLCKLVL